MAWKRKIADDGTITYYTQKKMPIRRDKHDGRQYIFCRRCRKFRLQTKFQPRFGKILQEIGARFWNESVRCIDCGPRRRYQREWARRHRHGMSIEQQARAMCNAARSRAKRFDLEFDLTPEWVQKRLETKHCEATGIPFRFRGKEKLKVGYKSRDARTPTIDRIDNSKGYTRDNCQVVVWIYNLAKGSYSHKTVVKFARALLNHIN